MKKCALLIVDGMGDLPVAALGGKTPLEVARTPCLDRLASKGRYGLVDPVEPGTKVNTHSGAGMLLGLLPEQLERLRRGVVEAAGLGLRLNEGDIALRANFATVDETPAGLLIRDRRAGRINARTQELAAILDGIDLDDQVTARVHATDQHRAVLVLSGPGLDAAVSDTDPGDRPMPAPVVECRPGIPEAGRTAAKINDFVSAAHLIVKDHPVNRERIALGKLPASGIITRGAGSVNGFDSILADRGLSPAMVAGCNTVKGLARMLGFKVLSEPGFTADADTDLDGKVRAAVDAFRDHDIVYLHIKAPDLCAHDRRPEAKRDFLERMDAALGPLADANIVVAVAADHTTDSNSGFHTADPVPVLLADPAKTLSGPVIKFGESACRKGNMARQKAGDFLQMVLDAMGAGGR